jgi:hypothetical protein
MGAIGGAIGGLLVAIALINKFNNFPKFRWTIKSFLLGIGAGLLAKNQGMLGVVIANVVIFTLVFGAIGVIIDVIKNNSAKNQVVSSASNNSIEDAKKPAIRNTSKNDEDFWELALNEFESENRKKGLYAKLYSLHTGDEAKIKSEYMHERYSQLKEEDIAAGLAVVKNEFKENSANTSSKKKKSKKLPPLRFEDMVKVFAAVIFVVIIGELLKSF